jgi:hypothetical protein
MSKNPTKNEKDQAALAKQKNYVYYQKLVVFLEKLKRESDLEMGPKLLDKIIDAQKEGELTSEQVMELSERIQNWVEKRHEYFVSQEFQMKKLLRAIENEDRRCKKPKVPQSE